MLKRIGKRVFFDVTTGEIIQSTSERQGEVTETTIEQDITVYKALSERNRETFDVLELEYGDFAQDFAECNGYRVNAETKTLEFSYPDPNTPEEPPVFQRPLSEQVKEVKLYTQQLNDDLMSLSEYVTTL